MGCRQLIVLVLLSCVGCASSSLSPSAAPPLESPSVRDVPERPAIERVVWTEDVIGLEVPFASLSVATDADVAVGPEYVVAIANFGIVVYEKAALLEDPRSVPADNRRLDEFWTDGTGLAFSSLNTFDSRIIFDPASSRFLLVSSSRQPGLLGALVAASPAAGMESLRAWHCFFVPLPEIAAFPGAVWDYPVIATDEDEILVWGRTVLGGAGTPARGVLLDKADVLEGRATTPWVVDLWDNFAFDVLAGEARWSGGPAPPSMYFLAQASKIGYFNSTTDFGLENWPASAVPNLIPASPITAGGLPVNLETSARPKSSEFQDGCIWMARTRRLQVDGSDPDDPFFNAIQVSRFDLDGWPSDPRATFGRIDRGIVDPSYDAYYAGIAVDPYGNAVVTYTRSTPDTNPEAIAQVVPANGPIGDPIRLKASEGMNTGGRWIDYCEVTRDPSDSQRFWIHQGFRDAAGTPGAWLASIVACARAGEGDVDCDGDVDAADLVFLLGEWGREFTCSAPADLDLDGDVGLSDLLILLQHVGG